MGRKEVVAKTQFRVFTNQELWAFLRQGGHWKATVLLSTLKKYHEKDYVYRGFLQSMTQSLNVNDWLELACLPASSQQVVRAPVS